MISPIVTRGFGSYSDVFHVPTRGFSAGESVSGIDTHDGGRDRRHDKAQRKRWAEQLAERDELRAQITSAYADVTGEAKVPGIEEIVSTERQVKKWAEPELRRDGLAYLAHVGQMLRQLREVEAHMARMRQVEEEDVAWIVSQLGAAL